jgi:hypothetical protein
MIDQDLELRAREYAKRNDISANFTNPLGFGQDGRVWKTDRTTAIKVFERVRTYNVELECYRRFTQHGIKELCGLAVPQFEANDDELLVIEIGIVKPPYILDFGKAHLDQRPDFPEDTRKEWESDLEDLFGDGVTKVRSVLWKLSQLGIHYYDAKPKNIAL